MFLKSKRWIWSCFASLLLISSHAYSGDREMIEQANAILVKAAQNIDEFDSVSHWESVKNVTGVAKAIVIFPSGGQAGFLLGVQWGKGILLTRDAHHWSEPVFVTFRSAMFGLLAGAQKINGVGVILSDDVVEQLQSGSTKIGGTADVTIGNGVSGKVVGGTSGISAMMVSQNKGLYFGGSIDTFNMTLDDKLNNALYGDDFSVDKVLTNYDHQSGQAQNLRRRLEGIAYRAVYR
ncbi:lipid-binding SYLF domain-containing protein [Vibrio wakamikoensis]|uniref:Lipid-binding SYLF domain-containing protein n=1 Tax=Vibrio chaetopteri TaxID=3016528 RepID=A0AAU8BMJ1_9VIBR